MNLYCPPAGAAYIFMNGRRGDNSLYLEDEDHKVVQE